MADHYASGPWPRTMPAPPVFVDIPDKRILTIYDEHASRLDLSELRVELFIQLEGDPIMTIPIGLDESHLGTIEMLWHPIPSARWVWQARIRTPGGDVFHTPVISGNPPPPPPRFQIMAPEGTEETPEDDWVETWETD